MLDTKKKFYIETYGCQMNVYDSMIAQNILEKNHAVCILNPEEADLILLNTCAIRENAHEKVYNRLKALAHLRKNGAKIGVLGCMSQNLKDDLFTYNVSIDFIMGPDSLRNLPNFLYSSPSSNSYLELSSSEIYDDMMPSSEQHLQRSKNQLTAFVTIQRGCNNFCSFCVVPFTRGRERSKSREAIVIEIQNLVDAGFKSVILLGQNVNSYCYEGIQFYDLVESILEQTTIQRIYFTSPHPKDFPQKLIHLMKNNPRFCNHVHMPLQAGSDFILDKMKRNYTSAEFLDLVGYIRHMLPNVCITTDVIVGFPGETRKHFEDTLLVMQQADFDSAFMFAYSQRKQTLASKVYEDDVSEAEKKMRLQKLINQQLQRSLAKNQIYLNKDVSVLVEKHSKRSHEMLMGSLLNSKKVIFETNKSLDALLGQSVDVKIHAVTSNTLLGKLKHSMSSKETTRDIQTQEHAYV